MENLVGTTREKAMQWWNSLGYDTKALICQAEGTISLVGKNRQWKSLTGREIEMLFTNE